MVLFISMGSSWLNILNTLICFGINWIDAFEIKKTNSIVEEPTKYLNLPQIRSMASIQKNLISKLLDQEHSYIKRLVNLELRLLVCLVYPQKPYGARKYAYKPFYTLFMLNPQFPFSSPPTSPPAPTIYTYPPLSWATNTKQHMETYTAAPILWTRSFPILTCPHDNFQDHQPLGATPSEVNGKTPLTSVELVQTQPKEKNKDHKQKVPLFRCQVFIPPRGCQRAFSWGDLGGGHGAGPSSAEVGHTPGGPFCPRN